MAKLFTGRVLATLLLLAAVAQGARGQALAPVERSWYVGVQGGTSFGQGTFRSITEQKVHWGLQGGLFGGYRFNRLLSVELGARYGAQSQYALDCCPYWMSEEEVRYMAPVLDEHGWYYKDLRAATQWGKLALQANIDLLSLLAKPSCRWSLTLSPQISAVTTSTRLITPDREIPHERQWHLGLGGEAGIGFQISQSVGVALYGSITCLTGERFDNIPIHAHKSNLLWDAGLKLTFGL
jgi:hypothetical protein